MAKVSAVKGGDRKENIRNALDLLKKEISESIKEKGKDILFVKVNSLDSTIPKACTHPDALDAVLEYFCNKFNRIVVGDNSSCFTGGPNIYAGLKNKFDKLEFSNLKEFATSEIEFEMLNDNVNARISNLPKKAYTISLALPKTHDNFIFTGCSKNMLGCVVGNRACVHALKAHERLFLNNIMKANAPANRNLVKAIKTARPDLAVMDGFMGMEGEGPAMGKTVELGVAFASLDCAALDRAAARLCGFGAVPYLDLRLKEGTGMKNAQIVKRGFSELSDIARKFEQHPLAKYQTASELKTIFPKVNLSLVKAVIANPHPHRMAAKLLGMMARKSQKK